ncbi:MAG: hypothetical protein ACYCVZ_01725 [Streptosporangiaceae bacterium]
MSSIAIARERIERARDLPDLLDAAFDAFQAMLAAIGCWEEHADGAFGAFVFSGAAAANGRDWIAGAPSLPRKQGRPEWSSQASDPVGAASVAEAASALARLAGLMARQLMTAGTTSGDSVDRESCAQAAKQAARIHSLLTEPEGP